LLQRARRCHISLEPVEGQRSLCQYLVVKLVLLTERMQPTSEE
jgi:hypothetical protein